MECWTKKFQADYINGSNITREAFIDKKSAFSIFQINKFQFYDRP